MSTSQASSRPTLAVVLSLRPDVDAAVQEALQSHHQWHPIVADKAAVAMAVICRSEQRQVARTTWGLQRTQETVLVLDVSQPNAAHQPLLEAIGRYAPHVAVWTFHPEQNEQLELFMPAEPQKQRDVDTSKTAHHPKPASPARQTRQETPHPIVPPVTLDDQTQPGNRMTKDEGRASGAVQARELPATSPVKEQPAGTDGREEARDDNRPDESPWQYRAPEDSDRHEDDREDTSEAITADEIAMLLDFDERGEW